MHKFVIQELRVFLMHYYQVQNYISTLNVFLKKLKFKNLYHLSYLQFLHITCTAYFYPQI